MSNIKFLFRKKKFESISHLEDTNLSRVLNLFDITALGISCTLGVGIYILAGDVISNYAGPGIIFSFLIAGFATFIAGLCYAELGSRVPRSGSAYTYIYVTIGELAAFIIGWDIILEYVIGVSSTASALSAYIDTLVDYKISTFLRTNFMIDSLRGLTNYPDLLACLFVLAVTVLLIFGVKESSYLNNVTCILNIGILISIICIGLFGADFGNWKIDVNKISNWTDLRANKTYTCETSNKCGTGGFLPFGIAGVFAGAAKCFYAFIGFDCISSTGEEVQNPKKNLPLSIILTLVIVSLLYCTTSTVLTLMIPYYLIDTSAPIPDAFEYVQFGWAKNMISIGAIASLVACLYGSIFAVPRILYSMSQDGLIFSCFSKVLTKMKTPMNSILSVGIFSALMATILDLNQLIDLMSIGTLMAYSFVAICVLVLRFRPNENDEEALADVKLNELSTASCSERQSLEPSTSFFKTLFAPSSTKTCSNVTSNIVNFVSFIAVLLIFIISIILVNLGTTYPIDNDYQRYRENFRKFNNVVFSFLLIGLLITCMFIISRQPENKSLDSFKIPYISVMPLLSVFINVYLMMTLNWQAWVRFIIWLIGGLIIYFGYGTTHSLENKNEPNQMTPTFFSFSTQFDRTTYENIDSDKKASERKNDINTSSVIDGTDNAGLTVEDEKST